jgi:hypothetical protein
VADDVVTVAGQDEQAGRVADHCGVILGAVAGRPAEVHGRIALAGVLAEEAGNGRDEIIDVVGGDGEHSDRRHANDLSDLEKSRKAGCATPGVDRVPSLAYLCAAISSAAGVPNRGYEHTNAGWHGMLSTTTIDT